MKYRKGYKYQLAEDECAMTDIKGYDIETEFITLSTYGRLQIKSGYAWDGATGAIDTDALIFASLIHDALYQLLRLGLLPPKERRKVDRRLREDCVKKKMWKARAWWVYNGVRKLAGFAADPKNKRKVYEI